jgi:hypothetical protein
VLEVLRSLQRRSSAAFFSVFSRAFFGPGGDDVRFLMKWTNARSFLDFIPELGFEIDYVINRSWIDHESKCLDTGGKLMWAGRHIPKLVFSQNDNREFALFHARSGRSHRQGWALGVSPKCSFVAVRDVRYQLYKLWSYNIYTYIVVCL